MNDNITILVVEDEMIIGANISLQLTNLGYEVIGIIPRGEEVLPKIRLHQPKIILLDINLKGDLDGIELAHLIQKEFNIPIIYLTANSDEHHFNRAKFTHPYAFLSKPFKKIDLQRAIELVILRIEEEKKQNLHESETFVMSDSIFVRSHDKMIKINIDDILFIEAERNYSKIHCKEKQHLIVSTLKDLEEKLNVHSLMRIHRSYIINMQHIDEIASTHIVIAKKAIPITVELKKQLLLHIQKV